MLKKRLLLVCFVPILVWGENPWGKDESLIHFSTPIKKEKALSSSNYMIRFHQDVISPADGPRSHFYPSSSEYTKQAMEKYGFFKGFLMGCDRLMRENNDPWVYSKVVSPEGNQLKWDPVK